jgi:16S rRNA (guanine527-N7)-methyltransferase
LLADNDVLRMALREGVSLSASQARSILAHAHEVATWSDRARLAGRRDTTWLVRELSIPSLLVVQAIVARDHKTVLDIGSGAGFPAVPAAIVLADVKFVLVEATRKKCLFLDYVRGKLALSNVEVLRSRVEDVTAHPLAPFRFAMARGVGPADRVVSHARGILAPLAQICTFTGVDADDQPSDRLRLCETVRSKIAPVSLNAYEVRAD